jgi:hypothetical protein
MRRFGMQRIAPRPGALTTFGNPKPPERAGEPSDGRFGRTVSDKVVSRQLNRLSCAGIDIGSGLGTEAFKLTGCRMDRR